MAKTTLIGFDGFATGAATTYTVGALNSVLAPPPFPGAELISGATLGNCLAAYDTSWTVAALTLGNGTVRNFLQVNQKNSSAYLYHNLTSTYLATLDRTGKWYYGQRMRFSTMSQIPIVAQVRLGASSVTVSLPSGSTQGFYYVEMVVDWVNLTMTFYINGVQVAQYTGSSYVNATYASPYVRIGPQSSYSGSTTATTLWLGMTDIYFVVEASNEASPLPGRFGPIYVKQAPFEAVSNGGRFTPGDSTKTVLDLINGNNTALGAAPAGYTIQTPANNVTTDPHGDIASFDVTAPTEANAIKAVTVQVMTHKLQAAAAGTSIQLKQGSTALTADKAVPGLYTAPTIKFYSFLKALDGADWTNDKVGQLNVNVGSYRP